MHIYLAVSSFIKLLLTVVLERKCSFLKNNLVTKDCVALYRLKLYVVFIIDTLCV